MSASSLTACKPPQKVKFLVFVSILHWPLQFLIRSVGNTSLLCMLAFKTQAVHDMTEDSGQPSGNGDDSGDRYARAAQVLAAVVSGLTCTPEELSLKYKSNRGAQPAMDAGAGMAGAVAKPSIQKIRDYQLQVTWVFF